MIKEFKWYSNLHGSYCNASRINRSIDQINTKYRKNYGHYNIPSLNSSSQARKRIFLVSHPRSGNHLTRAVLECLLETATYGYHRERYSIYMERHKPQIRAWRQANIQHPFIRKYHNIKHISSSMYEYGLIFLIRDPVESIISGLKTRPYFWRNYEQAMESLLDLATFYINWNNSDTKLLLYYEDYFNISQKWINLFKIQSFFGKDRISDEQLKFCIDNFENVRNVALSALPRTAKGHNNLHHYRDSQRSIGGYWPEIKVPLTEYNQVFNKYDNLHSCS